MNRWRLTRGPWTRVLRRAIRVDNGERIAASVIALVAFVGSIGTFLYADLYAKSVARSMASRPGHARALGAAQVHSRLSEITATGLERTKLALNKYYDMLPPRRQTITWDLLNAIEVVIRRLGTRGLEGSIPEDAVREHARSLDNTHIKGRRDRIPEWAVAEDILDAARENYVRRIYGSEGAAKLRAPVREESSKIKRSLTALSYDVLGLRGIELTSRKAIPNDGPDSLLESAFWLGIGRSPLLGQSAALPLPHLSLTLHRHGSQRALRVEGAEEFFIEPRVIVQSPPPGTSGAYAQASIAGSSRAHSEQCGSDEANLRAPEHRADAVYAVREGQSVASGCWGLFPDVMASVSGCDASAPGGIRLRCGEYVAGEAGLDPQPPIALSAVMPRDAGVATTVCAGSACRSPGGPTTQPAREDSASIYSSLAALLQISAPTQLRILPAPPSGWVDIGYVSPATPRWKQSLGLICEASQLATPSSLRAQCGLPSAANSGVWGMSFQAAGLEGAFSSGGWHLNMSTPSGINVLVASALQTPLQDFDIDSSWGVRVSTPWGLQLIGTSSGIQVLQYIDLSFGQLFAGITPQGPIGGLQFEGDTVNGNISALMSAGQLQAIGDVTVRAGDFDFTSTLTTSDFQLGVSYTFRDGPTVQLSWSNVGGFSAAYMIPNGPTVQLSLSSDNSFTISLTAPLGSGVWPTIAPVGGGALGFTPSSAFNTIAPSMHFRWPLATSAQPPVPAAPGLPPASATVVIRFCVDSNGDGVCRQAESRPPSRALVDGQPTTTTDGRISVSPGHHTITVPLELVPARLVPLGDLTCDLTISASTVGFCDLLVHHA